LNIETHRQEATFGKEYADSLGVDRSSPDQRQELCEAIYRESNTTHPIFNPSDHNNVNSNSNNNPCDNSNEVLGSTGVGATSARPSAAEAVLFVSRFGTRRGSNGPGSTLDVADIPDILKVQQQEEEAYNGAGKGGATAADLFWWVPSTR